MAEKNAPQEPQSAGVNLATEEMGAHPGSGGASVSVLCKIKTVEEAARLAAECRSRGQRVVHCHGVFDLLHIGHIRHLSQAKALGDVLVVTLTPDRFVDKGPDRPAFAETLRAEALASLAFVDFVAINEWPTAEQTLRLLHPDIYAKGVEFKETASDRTGKIGLEEKAAQEIGTRLAFAGDIVFSSSNLINRYLSRLPREQSEFMARFRQQHDLAEMQRVLEGMASLKVLVLGDALVEEYQFGEVTGRSHRAPVLAFNYRSREVFLGGALAVANNLAALTGKVDMITILGGDNSHEQLIRARMHPGVDCHFLVEPGATTTTKCSFVDRESRARLLEVRVADGVGLSPAQNQQVCAQLERELRNYDLVVCLDLGRGALSGEVVEVLCRQASFLALGVHGVAAAGQFQLLGRYGRGDYACLAAPDSDQEEDAGATTPPPNMDLLAGRLGCKIFAMSHGRHGYIIRDRQGTFGRVPSFQQDALADGVGPDDAFFSVSSLAAAAGAVGDMAALAGSLAEAMATDSAASEESLSRARLEKYLTALMK